MEKIYKNDSLAGASAILFIFMAVLNCALIVYHFFEIDLISNSTYTMDEVELYESISSMIGIVYLVSFIVTGVVFLILFRRFYKNVQIITKETVMFSENSAIWSWFVPFLNLVRPYKIMKEIWVNYSKQSGRDDREDSGGIITVWWGVSLFSGAVSRISLKFSRDIVTVEDAVFAGYFSIADCAISIVAVLIFAYLINQIRIMENIAKTSQLFMPEPID
jgi:hypothetical protein